jgi:hypothetical protein
LQTHAVHRNNKLGIEKDQNRKSKNGPLFPGTSRTKSPREIY